MYTYTLFFSENIRGCKYVAQREHIDPVLRPFDVVYSTLREGSTNTYVFEIGTKFPCPVQIKQSIYFHQRRNMQQYNSNVQCMVHMISGIVTYKI
jgi:hypothetical protein